MGTPAQLRFGASMDSEWSMIKYYLAGNHRSRPDLQATLTIPDGGTPSRACREALQ